MQPLEQSVIIEAIKQWFETMQQNRSDLESGKTRRDWKLKLARVLVKIAQHLEPDSPITSRRAKQ